MEHTEWTKFRVTKYHNWKIDTGDNWFIDCGQEENAEANAGRIVEAVNCHDDLLEALLELQSMEIVEQMDIIEQALARADL